MERKILSYSISILLFLLMSCPLLEAQTLNSPSQRKRFSQPQKRYDPKKEEKAKEPIIEYPLFNGISVGMDLWGIAGNLFGSDFVSSEISVDANLKNRYFPTVEVGYGGTDTWNEFGIHYKSKAPFFRIGADYNTMYNKKHGNLLLVGLRYAASSFKYDVMTPAMDDPIYGGEYGNPNLEDVVWDDAKPGFNHKGMKGSMQWLEFCVGIRARIWKELHMGWSVRYKFKLSASTATHGDPWYVPGFGEYNDKTLGITYSIIYKLPYKTE